MSALQDSLLELVRRTHRSAEVNVRLILKGGGCENVVAQYSLPNEKLKANRDLDGCRKAILDAVLEARGKGCGPGILGVCTTRRRPIVIGMWPTGSWMGPVQRFFWPRP